MNSEVFLGLLTKFTAYINSDEIQKKQTLNRV